MTAAEVAVSAPAVPETLECCHYVHGGNSDLSGQKDELHLNPSGYKGATPSIWYLTDKLRLDKQCPCDSERAEPILPVRKASFNMNLELFPV